VGFLLNKYDILVENWKKYLKEEDTSINTATVTAQAQRQKLLLLQL